MSLFKDSDIGSRFAKLREAEQPDADKPMDHDESYRIRAKMVGVLLRDARVKAGRDIEDCARLLHVPAEQVEQWEFGDEAPSLPQLEILAFFLGVPISHFWGVDTLEKTERDLVASQSDYLMLRDRMIGALLRLAREEKELSLEDVSAQTGIESALLEQYEAGEMPLPMHELTVISNALGKNITYFLESNSHLGDWLTLREQWKDFTRLPEDIRKFVANPLHVGFIEIAILFSQMPTDKLRKVGESVLNISL